MDFSFSDEQKLIMQSVAKFVESDYHFEARNKIIQSKEGFDREIWKQFAELGWLAVAFPENLGGFGGGPVETNIMMESFGRGMVVEPYLSTAVLGGNALLHGGSQVQKDTVLQEIFAGDCIIGLACGERESRYCLSDVGVTAEKSDSGFTLNGEKVAIYGGAWADKFIVSARTSGSRMDQQGITLFLLDKDTKGLVRNTYLSMDGARMANITLDKVSLTKEQVLGEVDKGFELLELVVDHGISALCAEALGAMSAMYEKTLAYVKERKQFGVAIGSFQAIQHRMVDMFMAVESSRSMALISALQLNSDDETVRKKAVSAAKVYIGRNARYCAQEAVQLHGGIGVTEELDIGHYFRRLTLFCGAFGSTDYHLKRFADLSK